MSFVRTYRLMSRRFGGFRNRSLVTCGRCRRNVGGLRSLVSFLLVVRRATAESLQ